MAAPACGSLRHVFDNTISENNKSSSPWSHIKTLKSPLDHSFTEIFGELHFKENHSNPTSSSSTLSFFPPPPPPSAFPIDLVSQSSDIDKKQDARGGVFTLFTTDDGFSRPYHHRRSDSFSSLNSDSLQLCTEGLGSESLGDVEDLTMEVNMKEKVHVRRHSSDSYCRKIRTNGKAMFPPPISYIGQAGKPSVSFQSYRHDGRFVLREVRIPTQECLQASREDGRLRLSIVQPDDIEEEDDEDEDEDEEESDEDDDNTDNAVEDYDGEEWEEEMSSIEDVEEEEEGRIDGVQEEDGPAVSVDLVRSYS